MTPIEFKTILKTLDADQVFDRCILTGACAAITDDSTHEARSKISKQFSVEYANVVIVGSSNLGFSIKPQKRYTPFGNDSDVDVAIICPNLFERVWHEVYLYDKSGPFWPNKGDFRKYLSKGWIRPDKLPRSSVFAFSNDWWSFFMGLKLQGCPYKISGGIYHSHFFLREYQKICIEQCMMES